MHNKSVYYVFLEDWEGRSYGVTGPFDITSAVDAMKTLKHTIFWGAPRIRPVLKLY